MLKNIIGQESAKQYLLGAYRQDRLAHAYLISGEEGWGAEELALEFARFLLCESPDPTRFEYCAQCRFCRQSLHLQHPDLHYYFPILKSLTEADIRQMLESKITELYTPLRITGGSIHIGDPDDPETFSIRALIREAITRSYAGKMKIFIVTFAEAMNAEAANALLKILEEPPPQTLFLLTSSQPDILLPTIRSRCQWLRLRPVPEETIARALMEAHNLTSPQALIYARLGEGHVGRSLQMVKGQTEASRNQMMEFLLALASPKPTALPRFLNTLFKDYGKDKTFIVQMLNQILLWFQDSAMIAATGSTPDEAKRYLIHADKTERLFRFTERFRSIPYEKIVTETEKSVELISRNVYLPLIITDLALKLRQHLMSSSG